jgi:hypothetical protein
MLLPRFSLTERQRRWMLAFGAVAWISLVCAGMWVLLSYEFVPGRVGNPADHWPSTTRLRRAPHTATLVMVVHPHCPCTRASLGELERLIARLEGSLVAQVLFYELENPPADWKHSDL